MSESLAIFLRCELVHVRGILERISRLFMKLVLRYLVTKAIFADERFPAMLDGVNETSEKKKRWKVDRI